MSEHPGLGEPTDVSADDLPEETDAPPPASSSAEQMRDDEVGGLGSGDGADPQPGGAG